MFNLSKIMKVNGPRIGGHKNLTTKQYKKMYGPKGDIDGDGILNYKDCRPLDPMRTMVHYGYYEATLETGQKMPVYAGSKLAAKRILDDQNVNYIDIRNMTFEDTKDKYGVEGTNKARSAVHKKYNWTGKKIIDEKEWGQ